MKNTELKQLIQNYLKEAKLMQLATANGDQPWVCSVWFAADNDLNIYWFSSLTRRHSQEVSNNKKVAGAIVLPQTPADPPRGLQFEGTAELVTNPKDIVKATSLYVGRIFSLETIKTFMKNKDKPHRFYKITPTQFVLFDTVNFPDNSRQEYNV